MKDWSEENLSSVKDVYDEITAAPVPPTIWDVFALAMLIQEQRKTNILLGDIRERSSR